MRIGYGQGPLAVQKNGGLPDVAGREEGCPEREVLMLSELVVTPVAASLRQDSLPRGAPALGTTNCQLRSKHP